MSESQHTRKWCRGQESLGALTYPLVGSRYAPPGWPDRYYAHFRWRGFIEFKSYKGKVKPLQIRVHQQLKQRGESVVVVRFSVDYRTIRIEELADFQEDDSKVVLLAKGWHNWGGFLDAVTTV